MSRTYSLALAVIVIAIIASAGFAFAAYPSAPAGYWALNEQVGIVANDSSGNGNNGAINGGALYETTTALIAPTPGNDSALTFDGVDDFVDIPNSSVLDMTAAYSLSAWVNVTDVATYRPILFRGATDADDIEVYVQSGTGDLIVAHNRGNGGTFDYVGFSPPPVGTLFHLTVTFDGTNVQAYYDGVAASVAQGAATVDAPLDTNKDWMMGKVDHSAFGGAFFFYGLLDEVFIYDRTITASEVAYLITPGGTHMVDDDGVIGLDNSCDGTGVDTFDTVQVAVDAANSGETVYVCPGIYDEQVVIASKHLTLQGAVDSTLIQPSAPAVLDEIYTYPSGVLPGWVGVTLAGVVLVKDADTVSVQDIKIDGANVTSLPSGAQRLSGIIYGEAGGMISSVTLNSIKTTGYADSTYVIDARPDGSDRPIVIR